MVESARSDVLRRQHGFCGQYDIDKKLLNMKVLKYEFDIKVWLSGYKGGHYQILVIEVE